MVLVQLDFRVRKMSYQKKALTIVERRSQAPQRRLKLIAAENKWYRWRPREGQNGESNGESQHDLFEVFISRHAKPA